MADFIFDINTIVAGNNGNKLPITIRNAGSIEGATVRIAIKRGASVFTKQADIIDATTGKCEVTLSASDIPTSGLYFYQPTITYADGREFTGEVGRFTVGGKLSGQPPAVVPAGIDLNRLGISMNNRLTIDGVEQVGGTGSGESGALKYDTLADLEAALPGGNSQPVWVTSEKSWYYWDGAVTEPPADTTAPILTISPSGGNFASTQGVTMTTNETADIYYTLDGSTPTTTSTKYTTALSLSATTTLKAFAVDTAGNSSAVQTVTFTKDVSAPADTTAPVVTASPAAGTYTSAQSVTLTANETATIYYTTNGTTPTTASSVYTTPINISATTTLQYMAKDTAGNQSVPVAATYTINIPQADTTAPVLTMTAAATFTDSQTVNMSVNETADIWYTVDGSDPVASGTRVKYSAPITLTATTTVKAYAVDTAGNASEVESVTYTKQTSTPPAIDSYALNFNGTTSIATSANNMGITGNQARSIEVRFRTNNIATNQAILEWGTISGVQANSLVIHNQKIMLRDGTNFVDSYANLPTALANATWYHVVFTYDGTNQNWYLNGVKKRGPETYPNSTPVAMATTATTMKFGSGSSGKLNGDIDFVRVYDRALTSTEITGNQSGNVVRTGLVNEWLINEGTGASIVDTVGSNNMTASNAAWVSNA